MWYFIAAGLVAALATVGKVRSAADSLNTMQALNVAPADSAPAPALQSIAQSVGAGGTDAGAIIAAVNGAGMATTQQLQAATAAIVAGATAAPTGTAASGGLTKAQQKRLDALTAQAAKLEALPKPTAAQLKRLEKIKAQIDALKGAA